MSAAMTYSTPASPAGATLAVGRWRLLVAAITLLAALLRIAAIDRHSFWYDEAVAADLARASVGQLFHGTPRDSGNPPLYWMVLHPWYRAWGDSEIALRSLSVIFGVAAVPMLAGLGRRVAGEAAGLLAAGLLAISPLAIELSNEARAYALLHLLTILCTWLFVLWLRRRSWSLWLAYAASVAALAYTHYFGFFVPLAHGLAIAVGADRRRVMWPWLGAMVVAAGLWMPWLGVFHQQIHTPGNLTRMGTRWPAQFAATPAALVFGRTLGWRDSPWIVLGLISVAAVLLVWVPAAIGFFSSYRLPTDRLAIGGWLILPILAPLMVALTLTPLYHVRAASVGLPALLLLAGAGLASLRRPMRIGTIAILLGLTGVSLARYATIPLKDDWRDATPVVLSDLSSADAVVLDTFIEQTSLMYYAQRQGKIPPNMIGLIAAPDSDGKMPGIRFDHGRRIDDQPRDCSPEIFSAPAIWLILCVPAGSATQYQQLMTLHGYALDRRHEHFQRIDLYHYVRVPASP
ncbi:MAG: glycosyltransferase family 39 protein [Tepidisphaeraceae bacterium]|jgi:4-amino-4-deoxy-L-arabinose transferase-like glycosyltransferase